GDIQVKGISVEDVKPSGNPQDIKPFKLNLFDQLMPSTYIPLVSFYPSMKPNIDNHLKTVSANTLNLFYPLSGRLQDNNLLIHDFHKGVPFTVAQINGHDLLNFLQPPNLKSLNALLPVKPFSLHPVHGPQIAVQLRLRRDRRRYVVSPLHHGWWGHHLLPRNLGRHFEKQSGGCSS
ncbi:Salutaridinol 7-O-acetyltransferase, partial [Linum perenne]